MKLRLAEEDKEKKLWIKEMKKPKKLVEDLGETMSKMGKTGKSFKKEEISVVKEIVEVKENVVASPGDATPNDNIDKEKVGDGNGENNINNTNNIVNGNIENNANSTPKEISANVNTNAEAFVEEVIQIKEYSNPYRGQYHINSKNYILK